MTVRYWLAARLQDKLQNPRQAKNVPRVECPEDPNRRRVSIAAVFPDTTLYNSEEEVAHVGTQASVGAAERLTQLPTHREHSPRRKSTRRLIPSARAIDAEQRFKAISQAGQRKSTRRGATGVFASPRLNPQVAPSQSLSQRSNDNKPDTAEPTVDLNARLLLMRKRSVIYVKPSRKALSARKLTISQPSPASSIDVTQEPLEGVHAPPYELSSAPGSDPVGTEASQNRGNALHETTPPTEHTISQNTRSHRTILNQTAARTRLE